MAKDDVKDEFWTATQVNGDDDDPWSAEPLVQLKLEPLEPRVIDYSQPYNNPRPLIVVDLSTVKSNMLDRGDAHGLMGIAEQIAKRISGDVLILRQDRLNDMMKSLNINLKKNNLATNEDKVRLILRKTGGPDFYLSKGWPGTKISADVKAMGCGLIVDCINETLPHHCGVGPEGESHTAVPTHMSKEKAEWHGHLFAQEYEDLPRPFIALNLADRFDTHTIIEQLSRHCSQMEGATFFVTSCNRTDREQYISMVYGLKNTFPGENFHVVGFDKKYHDEYQAEERLNPYIGLTAAADHVIVCGYSASMMSERIFTGRSVIIDQKKVEYNGPNEAGMVASLYAKDLVTKAVQPIDITGQCAESLIAKHQKFRASRPAASARYRAPKNIDLDFTS